MTYRKMLTLEIQSVYPSSRFGLYPNTLEESKSAVNALSVLVVNILLVIVLFIASIGATEGITMTIGDHIKDIFAYRL